MSDIKEDHVIVRKKAHPLSEPGAPLGFTSVIIRSSEFGIELHPKGTGVATALPGTEGPIFLEHYQGEWWLRVWADINQEDPTHSICLTDALETNYNGG